MPVVHRGDPRVAECPCEADAAARGGFLWTHRCKRCRLGAREPWSVPSEPRGVSMAISSVRSRSQIACSASAVALSRRLSGKASGRLQRGTLDTEVLVEGRNARVAI